MNKNCLSPFQGFIISISSPGVHTPGYFLNALPGLLIFYHAVMAEPIRVTPPEAVVYRNMN
jgi:hypothetical protein